jgi:dephospho-CoA kinase
MKLVIGITGPPLSGKETVARKLDELFKRDGFGVSRHRFGDIIRETLTLWDIPLGRKNEQVIPALMDSPVGFGPGTLSHAMKSRLSKDTTDVGVLDGVRWFTDEKMLRNLPATGIASAIIYVTASADRRFVRLKERNRSGEGAQSRDEFDRYEKASTEVDIPAIGERADVTLMNDSDDLQELYRQIEIAYKDTLRPLIS